MEQEACARLESRDGRPAMLEGLVATGELRGLLLEMSVEQCFRNTARTNMEVIYRFPLPWGAVLLGVDVMLNGQHLTGSVVEKRQAEARYEEALSQGQSAIMLERNHDGSYSLNLGNLLAGEVCRITLRYAQVLQFAQDGLRLLIPTVIAPRYGDPVRDGGLQPHQAAASDLLAAYPFEIRLRLHGSLVRARVASPSHPIAVGREESGGADVLVVSLARQGALDRDFVLVIDQLTQPSMAVLAGDPVAASRAEQSDQVVVLASFLPRMPVQTQGQAIKILVDCSGSMAGDSIVAARRALQAVLLQLGSADRFSLSRFGSTVQHRARGLWSMTEASRLAAQRWVGGLEADLGGTEMEGALVSTCALAHGGDSDLLLVTDGEIEAIDRLIDTARGTGHRVFVVGIGASPAEGHVRRLAAATGGACDFVAPGEAVEPAVLRMFARLRSPRLTGLRLVWPEGEGPLWASPLETAIFDGDTVNCFAVFKRLSPGTVRLLGVGPNSTEAQEVACAVLAPADEPQGTLIAAAGDALARMAVMARIQSRSAADAVELAVAYQLVTDRTNFLLVHARAEGETPTQMPDLHTVAQMVPASWGGLGSVVSPGGRFSLPGVCESCSSDALPPPPPPASVIEDDIVLYRRPSSAEPSASTDDDLDALDLPAFLRQAVDDNQPPAAGPALPPGAHPGRTPLALSNWLRKTPRNRWPRTYRELTAIGLGAEVLDWLELVVAVSDPGHWEEETVVTTFLHCLSSDEVHTLLARRGRIDDTARASVQGRHGARVSQPEAQTRDQGQTNPVLAAHILTALRGITAEHWPDAVFSLTT
ncbi:VIT domain-containing protein [uncultured Lamprocystis sp.]|uniref:VIT domain-containing protein n=1 Tax=uncultured Lamprocystis sp. TaxID=543132 RepID=UPI0025FEF1C6|nr:VIT domain-containing protein [uncultured Lamprocystis sp.]